MKSTLKRDIKLKDGRQFFKGEKVNISFNEDFTLQVSGTGEHDTTFKTSTRKGFNTFTGFCKAPSMKTLEKWVYAGISRTVTGDRCEPDGYGEENSPSWLLVLGYI